MVTARILKVRIRPEAVVVGAAKLGREEGTLDLEPSESTLRAKLASLERQVRGGRHVDVVLEDVALAPAHSIHAEDLGGLFYRAIFEGDRQALFARCRGYDGHAVRVVLEIDPRAGARSALAALPWELLYSRQEQAFLALHRGSPVMRHIPVPVAQRAVPRAGRLRLLTVAAQPHDTLQLDLAAELTALRRLGKRRGISVRVLEGQDANPDSIRQALEQHRPHVVHFMGHGSFDAESGQGALYMVAPDGSSCSVRGSDLAQTLREADALRLVVLNACDTARAANGAAAAPLGGVSSAIVLAGIPSVIAMQRPISDRAAITFANELYLRIASGETLDQAVTLARQAVRTAHDNLEWSTPALFVGDPDELRIFRPSLWSSAGRVVMALLILAAPFLVLATLPSRAAPIDLEIEARSVSFEVAESQTVSPLIGLERLVARDVEALRLPAGENLASEDGSQLDVEVRPDDGDQTASMTLQPLRVSGAVRVTLEWIRQRVVRLSVDGDTRNVALALHGRWRLRRRGSDWQAFLSEGPQSLMLTPRAGHLSLDLTVDDAASHSLEEGISARSVSLHEIHETIRGGQTVVTKRSTLRGGRIRVGSSEQPTPLDQESVLRLDLEHATIHHLELAATGIAMIAGGRAREIRIETPDGSRRSLMPSCLTGCSTASRLAAVGAVGMVAILYVLLRFRGKKPRELLGLRGNPISLF